MIGISLSPTSILPVPNKPRPVVVSVDVKRHVYLHSRPSQISFMVSVKERRRTASVHVTSRGVWGVSPRVSPLQQTKNGLRWQCATLVQTSVFRSCSKPHYCFEFGFIFQPRAAALERVRRGCDGELCGQVSAVPSQWAGMLACAHTSPEVGDRDALRIHTVL